MSDIIDTMVMPVENGNRVGDLYFGIPSLPAFPTHTWTGTMWWPMRTDEDIMRAEIADLRADNERLRAALEEIVAQDDAAACCGKGCGYGDQLECCGYPEYGIDRAQRIARAALTAQPAAPGGDA